MTRFISELQQRGIFRVAAGYLVTSWAISKTAELMLQKFNAPEWALQSVLALLLVGFPVVLIVTWKYRLASLVIDLDVSDDVPGGSASVTQSATVGDEYRSTSAHSGGDSAGSGRILATLAVIVSVAAIAIVLVLFLDTQPAVDRTAETVVSQPDSQSIVVLPFVNLSSDVENEVFADGISETLLNMLARIPELRVISRSSAFSYKGRSTSIPDIAAQLNVTHVLEGSFNRVEDRVRVSASLIDAQQDTQVWSETYNEELDDIFAMQDSIAEQVLARLRVVLAGDMPASRSSGEAYPLYLKARHLSRGGNAESVNQAAALFEEVLALDPGFSEAWTDLGLNQIRQASLGLAPESIAFEQARKSLETALTINPQDATAMSRLGWIALSQGRLGKAATYLQPALEIEPGNSRVLQNAGQLLSSLGRHDQAVQVFRRALSLDPASASAHWNLSDALYWEGSLDEALRLALKAQDISPGHWGIPNTIGSIYLANREWEAALLAFSEEGAQELRATGTAMALYSLGQQSEFLDQVAELETRWGRERPALLAAVFIWASDFDAAFEWLERAVNVGDRRLFKLIIDPLLTSIHDDPRWLPFLGSIGWSPEQRADVASEFAVEI